MFSQLSVGNSVHGKEEVGYRTRGQGIGLGVGCRSGRNGIDPEVQGIGAGVRVWVLGEVGYRSRGGRVQIKWGMVQVQGVGYRYKGYGIDLGVGYRNYILHPLDKELYPTPWAWSLPFPLHMGLKSTFWTWDLSLSPSGHGTYTLPLDVTKMKDIGSISYPFGTDIQWWPRGRGKGMVQVWGQGIGTTPLWTNYILLPEHGPYPTPCTWDCSLPSWTLDLSLSPSGHGTYTLPLDITKIKNMRSISYRPLVLTSSGGH